MSEKPHLAQIDALRGIAAIVVAGFFHIRLIYSNSDGFTPLSTFQPFHWLQLNGYLFVDLFFVISGVVFTYNYIDKGRMTEGVTFSSFFKARIARLYPLHLFTLLVVAILTFENPSNTLEAFVAHLLFVNVFSPNPTDTFNGPAWSLSVEMLCYLVFALAALLGRVGLVAVISLVTALLIVLDPSVSAWGTLGLIIRGLFGFFVGFAVYQFAISRDIPTIVGWAYAPLAVVPFFLEGLIKALAFSALVWPCVIVLSLRLRVLGHPAFKWVGQRSYSIYLVHWPIFLVMSGWFALLEIEPSWWGQIMGIVVVLFVSSMTYRAIELPAQKLLKVQFGLGKPTGQNS